jgi:hypothetical protein
MYVLVRRDLAETYRLVQGAHAVVAYSLKGDQEAYKAWNNGTIVFLGVRNMQALTLWALKMGDKGIIFESWNEPDMGNQPTALACIDTGEIFKDLSII